MRWGGIHLRDLGQFGNVKVRFSDLGGPLIAVTGENGAGKTTFLELLAGALYRQCPTRGTLASLATSRNAIVEVDVETGGRRYTVRQTVDAISAKGEALVLDEAGQPVLKSAKVREYDDWAARTFPASEVLYSSSFAVQGERGFLDLKPAPRKQVLVRVLGLERVERIANRARERARDGRGEVDTLRAQLAEHPAPDIIALASAVADTTVAAHKAESRLQLARAALDAARAAAADAERAKEMVEQRGRALRLLDQAKAQLAHTDKLIANNRMLLGRAAEIRAAVAQTAVLRTELDAAERALGAAREALAAAKAEEDALSRQAAKATAVVNAARARLQLAENRLRDRDKVTEAIAAVPILQARESEVVLAIQEAERRIVELERMRVLGKDQRIAGLRSALVDVKEHTEPRAHAIADEAIVADDKLAFAHAAAPDELETARAGLTLQRRDRETLRVQISDAERIAARVSEMSQADADMVTAAREIQEALEAQALEGAARVRAASNTAERAAAVTAGDTTVAEAKRKLDALANDAVLGPKLDNAESRLLELAPQRDQDGARVADAEEDLARYPEIKLGVDSVHLHVKAFEEADREAKRCAEACARATQAHELAETVQARREVLERDLGIVSADLADWTRLGQDLGRDGLQALEIDCAVPELNTLTNELLSKCLGTRFTITLSTQRLTADGKRQTEELDVRVLDTEKGRDDLAETFSGGECVLLGEAISLALTTLACRRAGIEHPTLIRDETAAALDPAHGRAYVAMLRLAAQHIGADRVLFVTHDEQLRDLADSCLDVGALAHAGDDQRSLALATSTPELPPHSAGAGLGAQQ
jgi:DNA repair protein SbcC/Rad50